jgi:hypothetical protein
MINGLKKQLLILYGLLQWPYLQLVDVLVELAMDFLQINLEGNYLLQFI